MNYLNELKTNPSNPRRITKEKYAKLKKSILELPKMLILPTGSGETLVCLKMAFPRSYIIAHYNVDSHTLYSPEAPLNTLVELLADRIAV